MPSRQLTEILALVPADFADPEADYRAVPGDDGAVPRPPRARRTSP